MSDCRGERMTGSNALHKTGIAPLVLGPKDGLTMMSANSISVGHAALVAGRAHRAAKLADVTAALSLEAFGGNISVVDPAVEVAKPFVGQIDAAKHIRALLEGSYLQSQEFASVQDPLSLRVVPQVHGALREVLTFATTAVEVELNAPGDNPLVSADGRVVHNGNFEPLVMAVAFDALRIAIAHVGVLSERRMGHLWDAIFKHPEAFASEHVFYGLKLRYPAAARVSELKQLAAPATLDVPTLDMGVEDYASGAPLSVSKTDTALSVLEDLLAIELLLARDLLAASGQTSELGDGTRGILQNVETVLAAMGPGAGVADIHAAVRETMFRRR
jgi:histidine ammonia-lyase